MELELDGDVIENKNESNWAVGSKVMEDYFQDRKLIVFHH